MKKIIFLLLLAQTVAFLYAGSNCVGHKTYQGHEGMVSDSPQTKDWGMGIRSPQKMKCHCNCSQHKHTPYGKCLGCNHIDLPIDMKFSAKHPAQVKVAA